MSKEDKIQFLYMNQEGKGIGTIDDDNIGSAVASTYEAVVDRQHSRARKDSPLMSATSGLEGKEMIKVCIEAYEKVGIVRNIIDLISDFTSEGVQIIHTKKSNQVFWEKWMRKTKINEVVSKMINIVLKAGTGVVHRKNGKLNMGTGKSNKIEIPYGYIFYNPKNFVINKVDGYGIPIINIYGGMGSPTKELNADPANYIFTYKKDDWQTYARPFHYAALEDLAQEKKMQRMDSAAMDGIINAIRIWKIGGELKDGTPIFPTKAALAKLANVLQKTTGGGVTDILWDHLIDLKVEYPPVDKILGSEKYTHINNKILADFGIAQVLINGTGQGSYSNQYLSVKSLLEKVEYLQRIAKDWLYREIEFITKQMNFKTEPYLTFKNSDLGNVDSKRAIALQMYDRNIISKEQMLQIMDQKWDIEKERIQTESKEEGSNEELRPTGPFRDGRNHGSTVGDDGRPANDPDEKTQKKKRNTKPQGASKIFDAYEDAASLYDEIEIIVDPIFFDHFGVKHIKQLTKDKKQRLFDIKASIISHTESKNQFDTDKQELETFIKSNIDKEIQIEEQFGTALKLKLEQKQPKTAQETKNIIAQTWAATRTEGN